MRADATDEMKPDEPEEVGTEPVVTPPSDGVDPASEPVTTSVVEDSPDQSAPVVTRDDGKAGDEATNDAVKEDELVPTIDVPLGSSEVPVVEQDSVPVDVNEEPAAKPVEEDGVGDGGEVEKKDVPEEVTDTEVKDVPAEDGAGQKNEEGATDATKEQENDDTEVLSRAAS